MTSDVRGPFAVTHKKMKAMQRASQKGEGVSHSKVKCHRHYYLFCIQMCYKCMQGLVMQGRLRCWEGGGM